MFARLGKQLLILLAVRLRRGSEWVESLLRKMKSLCLMRKKRLPQGVPLTGGVHRHIGWPWCNNMLRNCCGLPLIGRRRRCRLMLRQQQENPRRGRY